MAKRVKFPLEMKDGAMVRTIEELQENFDVERLVEHYESGKLMTWLEDHYYDVEAQKVSELNRDAKNFTILLCQSLRIEVREEELQEVDTDFLRRRAEKLEYLKGLTEDDTILKHVDDIAINQDDLISLIDAGKTVIYLCQGDFTIPLSVPNMTYIGLMEPTAVVRAIDNVNFKEQHITFQNVPFIWDVSGLTLKDRSCQAERLFMDGQYEKAVEICRELIKEDNPRAITLLYKMSSNYICSEKESKECRQKGVELGYTYSLIDKGEWKFIKRYKERLKKAAQRGTSFDKFYYGLALYVCGVYNGGVYDSEMISYYQEAARQGNPNACAGLGNRYCSGNGVAQDYMEAAKWYQKAADNGKIDAMEKLAQLYDAGNGVSQDYSKSLELHRKAADMGNVIAMSNIGWHYQYGKGVIQDYTEAMQWYQKAAEKGSGWSQNKMGDMYYYGYGVSQDFRKAREWYQKAADNGNDDAKRMLNLC